MNDTFLSALGVRDEEQKLLAQYGFDEQTFARLQQGLRAGEFTPERNITPKPVSAPLDDDIVPWPKTDSPEAEECEALGQQAIADGQVAVAILNGGMATRFGGRVKGVVEVFDSESFLSLKLTPLGRARGPVPVFLMNSFATVAETDAHLTANRNFGLGPQQLFQLTQKISLRVTPSGELFRDREGHIGYYAPGHGDIFEVLATAPSFREFKAAGGRMVLVSNVDNLGATLSPRVLGAHLKAGRPVTVEVAPRGPGDKGGAPVRVGDHLEVLESFRFPKGFDINALPVFNTNTFVIDVDAVQPDYNLTWFRADKIVEQHPVVQFERLMGEVTAFVDAAFLLVPRDGPQGRFLPVKTPDDLISIRPAVRERLDRRR